MYIYICMCKQTYTCKIKYTQWESRGFVCGGTRTFSCHRPPSLSTRCPALPSPYIFLFAAGQTLRRCPSSPQDGSLVVGPMRCMAAWQTSTNPPVSSRGEEQRYLPSIIFHSFLHKAQAKPKCSGFSCVDHLLGPVSPVASLGFDVNHKTNWVKQAQVSDLPTTINCVKGGTPQVLLPMSYLSDWIDYNNRIKIHDLTLPGDWTVPSSGSTIHIQLTRMLCWFLKQKPLSCQDPSPSKQIFTSCKGFLPPSQHLQYESLLMFDCLNVQSMMLDL